MIMRMMAVTTILHSVITSLLPAIFLVAHQVLSQASTSQTVNGVLYAENFTYYKLSGDGWLRLELYSLEGDVDLYVSGSTLQPSFFEYELKSETCGVDVVDIHSNLNRPVGIGLYAHPFYIQSTYRLEITVVEEHESDEYEQLFQIYHYLNYDDEEENYNEEQRRKSDKRSKSKLQSASGEEESEEPLWWNILLTILKFILDVIV